MLASYTILAFGRSSGTCTHINQLMRLGLYVKLHCNITKAEVRFVGEAFLKGTHDVGFADQCLQPLGDSAITFTALTGIEPVSSA